MEHKRTRKSKNYKASVPVNFKINSLQGLLFMGISY